MFVHPAEASHGDLGMITAADLVLADFQQWRVAGNGRHSAGAQTPWRTVGRDDRQCRSPRMAQHADIWLDTAR